MHELTPKQMQALQRLFEAGFRPIAIPPYESALCWRLGECAVVLAPMEQGNFRILAPPSFLVGGKFGVRVKRGDRDVFVSKAEEVEATQERLKELAAFQNLLQELLSEAPVQ